MIELRDVSFRYSNGPIILSGACASFQENKITAVVGPNGTGKSTLARLCMGLLTPTEGTVAVNGHDPGREPARLIRTLVSLAWQNPDNQLVCGVVEDDVAFGPENMGLAPEDVNSRVDEVLNVLNLESLRRNSIHSLSSAQKQMVAVAGAMAIRPRFLFLDEVTSRLDPAAAHTLLEAVTSWARVHHAGVIMITHQLSEVLRADQVVRFDRGSGQAGKIAQQGKPADILRTAKDAEDVILETPLYNTVLKLEELGVHLSDTPETVAGLVDLLCR